MVKYLFGRVRSLLCPYFRAVLVYLRDGQDILLLNGLPSAARTRQYITLRGFFFVALVHARTTDSPHAVPNLPRVELFSYLRSIGMRVYRQLPLEIRHNRWREREREREKSENREPRRQKNWWRLKVRKK